jgi:uncharacterized integral membrane protein
MPVAAAQGPDDFLQEGAKPMVTQEPRQANTSKLDAPAIDTRGQQTPARKTLRSRAGAVWVGICIAAVVVIALIIFMLQNRQPVLVTFFSMQGTVPLAIALLIAGIGVGIIALVIGTIRIGQLRRQLSQERQR